MNNTFRQVGLATGIAGLGAVFQSQIQHDVTTTLASGTAGRSAARTLGSSLKTALSSGDVRTELRHLGSAPARAVDAAVRSGFAHTLDHLMLIGAGLSLAGALIALATVRQRDFIVQGAHGPAPAQTDATTAPAAIA